MADAIDTLSLYLPWLCRHGIVYKNDTGELHLTLPERLPFIDRDDTMTHIAKEGERLQAIAVQYYGNDFANAVDCWEVIAQFQEDPIVDGTLPLEAGRVILIPSPSYIREVALGDPLYEYPRL